MGPSSDHVSGNIVVASQQQQQQQQQQQIKCGSEAPLQLTNNAPPLRCPRCESANTKFCYYNNYSKSQPRHYCRACRRHWTEGGVLRDVPVGGLRKSKRRRTSKSPPTAAAAANDASASTDHEAAVKTTLHPTQFPPLDRGVAWFTYPPPSATANVENSAYEDMAIPPFASISSSSSGLSPCNLIGGVDEESLATFDGPAKAWPPPTPAEYWGEITDLVALELNSSSIPDRLWIE